MKYFLKKGRGSITVLVTLILVPTIFFTGFLVDLSRLKLYGNQAVMTADNYGEAVITQYDNLLKDLYGLFAVTQDEDAIKQLDVLQEYLKSSFDPADNVIRWNHFEGIQDVLGGSSYEGFMPYKGADVTLEHAFVEGANLGSHEVMSTQIGDFMKFRIAQQLIGDGSDVIEAIDAVSNMEEDSKAIDKKVDLDKKAEKIYELAREYYQALRSFQQYPEYVKGINQAYSSCESTFDRVTGSEAYKHYFDYETSDKEAMQAAVDKRKRIEEAEKEETEELSDDQSGEAETGGAASPAETLTEAENALLDIYDAYTGDDEARKDKLAVKLDEGIKKIKDSMDSTPIDFESYGENLRALKNCAQQIAVNGKDMQTLKAELEGMLQDGSVTEELKKGLQTDLDRMNELFEQIDYYTEIADTIDKENTAVNTAYKEQTEKIVKHMQGVREVLLNCQEDTSEWPDILDEKEWYDFTSNSNYKKLYNSLDKVFGAKGDEERGNTKKKEAQKMLSDAEKGIDKDEETSARDIPANFGFGKSYRGIFDIGNLIKEAVACFSVNNFKNEGNRLLLKLYTVEYDFGMFSSRVTNIKEPEPGEEKETAVSLTGYEKARDINYLYQAELEYLLGGSNSSKENLNAARNKILAVRSVVNFTATYSVKEINNAINAISDAAAAVNPILGLVVNGALRMAVAGVETAEDWKELKDGESVILIKSKLKHLTAYDKYAELLDSPPASDNGDEKEGLSLDYEQYLKIMMIFLTSSNTIAQRTANLIELNVNTVRQDIGTDGVLSELEFRMEDAHTAVDATCTVHLDFVVMPKGFARSAVSEDVYGSISAFEKNSYQFTVTRGY